MLKELNINVEIRTYEQATYIQALNEHEHDMGFSAWITSTGDADYTYYPCYHSTQKGQPGNRSFFDNPKADELIEKGRSLSDPEARKEVYSELNQIIYENCTQLYICHPLTVEACTKYVEGFVSKYGAWMGLFGVLPWVGEVIIVLLGLMRCNIYITTVTMFIGKFLRYLLLILAVEGVNSML